MHEILGEVKQSKASPDNFTFFLVIYYSDRLKCKAHSADISVVWKWLIFSGCYYSDRLKCKAHSADISVVWKWLIFSGYLL